MVHTPNFQDHLLGFGFTHPMQTSGFDDEFADDMPPSTILAPLQLDFTGPPPELPPQPQQAIQAFDHADPRIILIREYLQSASSVSNTLHTSIMPLIHQYYSSDHPQHKYPRLLVGLYQNHIIMRTIQLEKAFLELIKRCTPGLLFYAKLEDITQDSLRDIPPHIQRLILNVITMREKAMKRNIVLMDPITATIPILYEMVEEIITQKPPGSRLQMFVEAIGCDSSILVEYSWEIATVWDELVQWKSLKNHPIPEDFSLSPDQLMKIIPEVFKFFPCMPFLYA